MTGIKKIYITLIASFLLILCAGALTAAESDLYVKTVPIAKVYLHNLGFRVIYWKSDLTMGIIHVPMDWFGTSADSQAEVVYDTDPSLPYFSVFYENGEFHHIRLYLEENRMAQSWGDIADSANFGAQFNIETLNIEY